MATASCTAVSAVTSATQAPPLPSINGKSRPTQYTEAPIAASTPANLTLNVAIQQ